MPISSALLIHITDKVMPKIRPGPVA